MKDFYTKVSRADMRLRNGFCDRYCKNPADFPISYTYGGKAYRGLPADAKTNRRFLDSNMVETVIKGRLDGLKIKAVCIEYRDYPVLEWTVYFKCAGESQTALLEDVRAIDALFEGTRALPWERFIPREGQFPVKGYTISSQLHAVPACQSILKKAIARQLGRAYGMDTLPETGAVYQVRFSILKDRAALMLDTSGESLYKRGYRAQNMGAPLRETLAAALVALSGTGSLLRPLLRLGHHPHRGRPHRQKSGSGVEPLLCSPEVELVAFRIVAGGGGGGHGPGVSRPIRDLGRGHRPGGGGAVSAQRGAGRGGRRGEI